MDRQAVRKTYKLYIGGAFVRSESGRTYEVVSADDQFVANVALCSRKDARDAVVAARAAQPGWAKATAYNRGQVIYRIAEVMESRREQLEAELVECSDLSKKAARKEVDATIDRLVWYAGWTDKLASLVGSTNAVAAPFLNFTAPEPMGVVAIVCPQQSALLGMVSAIAPAIATGNSVVAVASYRRPLPAVTLAEILATSDVPFGVVNLLTGDYSEVAPWLASHQDVDGLDLSGVEVADVAASLESEAAVNVKRVLRPAKEDFAAEPGTARLRQWLEAKTVWLPIGN